jgi:hypothetical protein
MRATIVLLCVCVCGGACAGEPKMRLQLEPAPATCDADTIEGDTCALVGVVGFDMRFVVTNVGTALLTFDRVDDDPAQLTGEMPNTGELEPNQSESAVVRATAAFTTTIRWHHNGTDMPEEIALDLSFE